MKKFNQVFKRVFAVLIVFALFVSFNVKADELENATGLTDNLATETEEKEREVELAPPAESTGEISSVEDSQYQSADENVGTPVNVPPETVVSGEEDKSEPTTSETTPPNSVPDETVPPTNDGTDIDVTNDSTTVDETNGTTNVETDPVVETGTVKNEPTPVVEPSVDETSNNEVDPLVSNTEENAIVNETETNDGLENVLENNESIPEDEINPELNISGDNVIDLYQVTFTHENYEVNMLGGTSINLSTLANKLNINLSLNDVTSVTTSNGEVLSILKMAGSNDYVIKSTKYFETEETITIKTTTGEITINVVDPPAHTKALIENGDGTYQLSLDVTGEATDEVEAKPVNVLIMIDTSNSMLNNRANGGNSGPRRGDAAERVVYDFTNSLFAYQQDGQAIINMSLMTFNHEAHLIETWTTNAATITNHLSSSGNYNSAKLTYHSGTNYEAALTAVLGQLASAPNAPTFVIFVTDGAPSQVIGTADGTFLNASDCYGASQNEARDINIYDTASHTPDAAHSDTSLYGIYAYGSEADYLDDVIYYANNGYVRPQSEGGETSATVATPGYYNASNTTQLTQAISEIFGKIVDTMGIGAVTINDGTTSAVETTTDEISHLLDVDGNSFQYWLTIPVNNNEFKRVDRETGDTVTYTVRDNGNGTATITWGSNTLTVNGSVVNNKLKYEWTGANELYNVAPPTAIFDGEAVTWNLRGVGTLLDGVTYTVTFNCWPSQETLDLIADLENDPSLYDTLHENITKYLKRTGTAETGYSYTLLTNTTTSLTYVDTRPDPDEVGSDVYNTIEPVPTDAIEFLTVSKEWENDLDSQAATEITLYVMRDNESKYEVLLNNNNGWQDTVYISVGIISVDKVNGTVIMRTTGHDYSFKESEDLEYYWELEAPTVRPMIVNDGDPVMLVKVDESTIPEAMGSKGYYKDGDKEYYHLIFINGDEVIDYGYYLADETQVSLTATNNRKSYLQIVKEVDSEYAPEDAKFTYEITIEQPIAEGKEATEEDDIWFSIFDPKTNSYVLNGTTADTTYITATGLVEEVKEGNKTGYYHVPNGTAITVLLQKGWSLRFLNLRKGTTYSVNETAMPDNFAFESLTGVRNYKEDNSDKSEGTGTVNGTLITGTIAEFNSEYAVTYKNDYQLVDIKVIKVWDDNSNQDNKRPDSIDIAVKANGEVLLDENNNNIAPTSVVKNADNTWTITYEGLPKYADGKEISYTVEESTVPAGYSLVSTVPDATGLTTTITNKHVPITTTITVNKLWEDEQDEQGLRDTVNATVQLFADDVAVGSAIAVGVADNWSYTWRDLPVYADGAKITYKVTETLPDNSVYTMTGDGVVTVTDTTPGTITITNTYVPVYTSIEVEKLWDDESDAQGFRDKVNATLQLYADGEALGAPVAVEIGTNNKWTYTFADLPVYKDANGTAIIYKITETLPSGTVYTKAGDGSNITATTNAVSGTVTITNSYEPVYTSIVVNKLWDDESDVQGLRETVNATLQLYADGVAKGDAVAVEIGTNNQWTYTFADLPVYANGTAIIYKVTETLPSGTVYTKAGDGSNITATTNAVSGTVTITNTYEPVYTSVVVNKLWDDNSDEQGLRNTVNATIQLYADGETLGDPVAVEVGTDNEWTYTFENLDVYSDAIGTKITYVVTETLPEGSVYTKTGDEVEVTATTDAVSGTVTITNTYEPVYTSIEVEKLWDDANDEQGLRDSVNATLQLYADGVAKGAPVAVQVGTNNKWTYTFANLPVYSDANKTPIVYSVTETLPDNTVYSKNGDGSNITATVDAVSGTVTITNTYEPVYTSVIVNKLWDDENDIQGLRNTVNATIQLYADGETLGDPVAVEVGTDNEWTYTFENLDVYSDAIGTKITYVVTETLPEGSVYTKTGDEVEVTATTDEVSGTIEITNTYEPAYTSVVVNKLWDDESDIQGLRETVNATIQLYADGEALGDPVAVEVGTDDEWTYTFENLQVYSDAVGTKIVYVVTETLPDNCVYTKSGDEVEVTATTEEVSGTIEITNKYVPVYTSIEVNKLWDDDSDRDGMRKDVNATIQLFADGEELGDPINVEVGTDNEWTYVFENLQVYSDAIGTKITYVVTETLPEGSVYTKAGDEVEVTATTEEVSGTIEITNTHTPETIKVKVSKVWEDNDNQDGIRPSSVEVKLTSQTESEEEATVEDVQKLDDSNEWAYEWLELYKYRNGELITYDIEETTTDVVTNEDGVGTYAIEISKTGEVGEDLEFVVTNTHTPEVREIEIIKVWTDFDNQYETRPIQIVVRLYADGKEIKELILDESTEWKATVSELPVYENGKKIIYTVTEDEFELYEAVISGDMDEGFKIENFYSPKGGDNPPPPQTGDNVWMYLITLIVSLVGMGYSFYLKKRYN